MHGTSRLAPRRVHGRFIVRSVRLLLVSAAAVACGALDDGMEGMRGGATTSSTSGTTGGAPGQTPDGTGGTLGGAGAATDGAWSFAQAAEWIGATCGVANCHANRYPPSLSAADLTALQYTLGTYTVERCGNVPMVVPGDPESSAMPVVVDEGCGDLLMPFGCITPPDLPCLSDEEKASLSAWIARPDPFL